MPETETSLRLAFYLLSRGLTRSVQVAIDGAQVKTLEQVHFDIVTFLSSASCERVPRSREWRGRYMHRPSGGELIIHATSGRSDVVALLQGGTTLRAECKKGSLTPSRSSSEYPLLREALGQLLTIEEVGASDLLAVAVPHSERFSELALRWSQAPLVRRVGIQILTVARTGKVFGLNPAAPAV